MLSTSGKWTLGRGYGAGLVLTPLSGEQKVPSVRPSKTYLRPRTTDGRGYTEVETHKIVREVNFRSQGGTEKY